MSAYDWLIVGCGFTGATLAERIATELDQRVLIIDRRGHIAGNAHDFVHDSGLFVGKYGAHIFHTNSERVWDFVRRFARFSDYTHRVAAHVNGLSYSLPLNLNTVNSFFNTRLSEDDLPHFLEEKRIPIIRPSNAEEAVLNKVGRELYEAFYRNYTKKQWGIDPAYLDPSVTMRLPVRMNSDERYFSDRWQGMPVGGYTKLFANMLNNKNIDVLLNTDYSEAVGLVKFKKVIYTGNIDDYFGNVYGKLPYRSLKFEFLVHNVEYFQDTPVVNYPNDHDYTRIVEYKQLYQQKHTKTVVSREYPCWNDKEPYYPVPSPENQLLLLKYQEAASKLKTVYFCGRLGTYRYYNMDQCIAQALHLFETKISNKHRAVTVD